MPQQIGWSTEAKLLWQILQKLIRLTGVIFNIKPKYKVYTALLTQSGTDAPTAIVLENTLGFDILWQYNNVGNYAVDYSIIFDSNKTACFISPNLGSANISAIAGPGFIILNVVDYNGNPANGGTDNIFYLYKSLVEIRVYV